MKRHAITAGLIIVSLGGAGVWLALRRQPAPAALFEQDTPFNVHAQVPGSLITFQDARIPLRAFHWLPPMAGGMLAAQVLSQNDRQRVALFHDGQAQDLLLIQKPVGVSDGFWRFGVLRAGLMASPETAILLYQAGDPASTEAPLVLALDVPSQQVRWSYRGAGERLVLAAQGKEPAVFLFGGKAPIQRLALAKAAGADPLHPAATVIELPPEIPAVDDLLPTGAWSFLASHRNGLSAYKQDAGWTHYPGPEDRGVQCQDWKSSLVKAGRDLWWQAVPGKMVKVHSDGRPGVDWQGALPAEDPMARDARLLRVLGADPAGLLWFDLASPAPVIPGALAPIIHGAPAPAGSPPPPGSPGPVPAGDGREAPGAGDGTGTPAEDWGPYVAAGLDRLYRWNPTRKTLERVSLRSAWATLKPPPTVQPPVPGQGLVPAAGAMLAEGVRCGWWLPLQALAFEKVDQAM